MKFSFGNKTEMHWICRIGGIIILVLGIYWGSLSTILASTFPIFVGWSGFQAK